MQLRRVLGTGDAAWLVAGNMIGAGIFLTPGFVAAYLPGAGWNLGAWILGGGLALAGAAIYGELGTRIPRAGGDYQYLTAAFGPLWGFLTGWAAFLLTFSGAAAAMARTSMVYLRTALAGIVPGTDWLPVVGAPILILALVAGNVAGARVSGRATVIMTALPLLGLALLFCYGLLTGAGEIAWPERPFSTPPEAWPIALGAAMLPVFFTYSGWNAAAYVAGEIRDPGRSLPRGLLIGTGAVTVLFLGVNAFLLSVVPLDELAGSATGGAQAARRLVGPGGERAFALFIAVAIAGSTNVTLMAGARIYYAMASDRLAPRPLAAVNRTGVPHIALWAGGLWAALLATLGTTARLVEWTTLAILLLSAVTAAGLFILRRRDPEGGVYRCPGYPIVPGLYVLATLGVATASAVRDPLESLYGLLFVFAGLPVYLVIRRDRSRAP